MVLDMKMIGNVIICNFEILSKIKIGQLFTENATSSGNIEFSKRKAQHIYTPLKAQACMIIGQ